MKVVILKDLAETAQVAADAVCSLLERQPDAVLGLATGSSPLPLYAELIRRYRAGEVSFAQAQAFTLDEYIGLPVDHPQAYANVIRAEFTAQVDFDDGAVRGPDGFAADVAGACARYEEEIGAAGGVDLQILGVGTEGHIAFNEPTSSLSSRTRIKTLTTQTRTDNARFFDYDLSQVPQHSITQGLGTILEARQAILIAAGEGKAKAVWNLVEGPVSAMWPVTILQHHPHVTVLVDDPAAKELANADYYRETYATQPTWESS